MTASRQDSSGDRPREECVTCDRLYAEEAARGIRLGSSTTRHGLWYVADEERQRQLKDGHAKRVGDKRGRGAA